jgi:hypothetical protein
MGGKISWWAFSLAIGLTLALGVLLIVVGTRQRGDDNQNLANKSISQSRSAMGIILAVCQQLHQGEQIQADELDALHNVERWYASVYHDNSPTAKYHAERIAVFDKYDKKARDLLSIDCATYIRAVISANPTSR